MYNTWTGERVGCGEATRDRGREVGKEQATTEDTDGGRTARMDGRSWGGEGGRAVGEQGGRKGWTMEGGAAAVLVAFC